MQKPWQKHKRELSRAIALTKSPGINQHTHISHNSSSRAAAASGVGTDAGGGVVSAPFLEAAELGLGRMHYIQVLSASTVQGYLARV